MFSIEQQDLMKLETVSNRRHNGPEKTQKVSLQSEYTLIN